MKNPFEGKAVKFDTAEQLIHLSELAKGCGLKVNELSFISIGHRFFRAVYNGAYYSDFNYSNNLPEIHYSDFVASIEAVKESEIDYCKEVLTLYPDHKCQKRENGWSIIFGEFVTDTYPSLSDAYKDAYDMMVFKENFIPIGDSKQQPDMVNHPPHYTVNGIEVIDVIDAFNLNFNMGNALKYLLRADRKGNKVQDLKKALWYLQREIQQSEKQN